MTDLTHAAEPPATGYASSGFSPERIFIWVALIAALGFWLPYTFIVDHAIWQAMF